MKKIVYVLGNPLDNIDNLPLKLIPKLKENCPDFNFIVFDPTEELFTRKNLIFIDVVLGIKKVTLFKDLNQWSISPRMTVHDFDLPINLGIMRKLGRIKEITIIGIPGKGNLTQILKDIVNNLRQLYSHPN